MRVIEAPNDALYFAVGPYIIELCPRYDNPPALMFIYDDTAISNIFNLGKIIPTIMFQLLLPHHHGPGIVTNSFHDRDTNMVPLFLGLTHDEWYTPTERYRQRHDSELALVTGIIKTLTSQGT